MGHKTRHNLGSYNKGFKPLAVAEFRDQLRGKKQQGSALQPAGAPRPQTPSVWRSACWTRHNLGSYGQPCWRWYESAPDSDIPHHRTRRFRLYNGMLWNDGRGGAVLARDDVTAHCRVVPGLPLGHGEKTLLFITSNPIGDVVLTTGLLSHVMESYPGIRVSVATGPLSAPLFSDLPGLEHTYILRRDRRYRHWRALWWLQRGRVWDVVADLRSSVFGYLIRARRRFVYHKRRGRVVHRLAELGRLVGREDAPPLPRLWVSAERRAEAARLLPEPVLAIGPGATYLGKAWPASKYGELARRLTGAGRPVGRCRCRIVRRPGRTQHRRADSGHVAAASLPVVF